MPALTVSLAASWRMKNARLSVFMDAWVETVRVRRVEGRDRAGIAGPGGDNARNDR